MALKSPDGMVINGSQVRPRTAYVVLVTAFGWQGWQIPVPSPSAGPFDAMQSRFPAPSSLQRNVCFSVQAASTLALQKQVESIRVRVRFSLCSQLCSHFFSIVVCGGKLRMIFDACNRPSDPQAPSQTHGQSSSRRHHRQTSRTNRNRAEWRRSRRRPLIVPCFPEWKCCVRTRAKMASCSSLTGKRMIPTTPNIGHWLGSGWPRWLAAWSALPWRYPRLSKVQRKMHSTHTMAWALWPGRWPRGFSSSVSAWAPCLPDLSPRHSAGMSSTSALCFLPCSSSWPKPSRPPTVPPSPFAFYVLCSLLPRWRWRVVPSATSGSRTRSPSDSRLPLSASTPALFWVPSSAPTHPRSASRGRTGSRCSSWALQSSSCSSRSPRRIVLCFWNGVRSTCATWPVTADIAPSIPPWARSVPGCWPTCTDLSSWSGPSLLSSSSLSTWYCCTLFSSPSWVAMKPSSLGRTASLRAWPTSSGSPCYRASSSRWRWSHTYTLWPKSPLPSLWPRGSRYNRRCPCTGPWLVHPSSCPSHSSGWRGPVMYVKQSLPGLFRSALTFGVSSPALASGHPS